LDGSSADAATALGCHSDSGARLVCDRSKLDGIPWGPLVTIRQAIGHPPAPAGGVVVPGAYQLVSETLYGNVQPNTDMPKAGDRERRILDVDCGFMNELYQLDSAFTGGAGNDCKRLVSRELSAVEVSGWIATSGNPIPDLR